MDGRTTALLPALPGSPFVFLLEEAGGVWSHSPGWNGTMPSPCCDRSGGQGPGPTSGDMHPPSGPEVAPGKANGAPGQAGLSRPGRPRECRHVRCRLRGSSSAEAGEPPLPTCRAAPSALRSRAQAGPCQWLVPQVQEGAWRSALLGGRISSGPTAVTAARCPACSPAGTWMPGHLGTWASGHLDTWAPGHLGRQEAPRAQVSSGMGWPELVLCRGCDIGLRGMGGA